LRTIVFDLPGDVIAMGAQGDRDLNLLIVVPGKADQAPLLLNSHLDTVPPGDPRAWTATGGDPFRPRLHGDRLIGLGSADAKLDWLCKAEAIRRCARVGLRRPVHLLGTYGEERGMVGARSFLEGLGASRPAAALVGEPTQCQLVTRHKGLLIARLVLVASSRELPQVTVRSQVQRHRGRAAHSATPEQGESAILKALSALEDESPVLAIRGGDAFNRVPTWCEVEVAVRSAARASGRKTGEVPGTVYPMSPALMMAARDFAGELLLLAERSGGNDHTFKPPRLTTNIGRIEGRGRELILTFDVRPLPDGDVGAVRAQLEGLAKGIEARYAGLRVRLETEWENAALAPGPPPLVDMALETMGTVGLPHKVASMAGCTEAGLYASAGIPSVVFGAGQAAGNAHEPNEWTSVTQLRQAVEFYTAFIQAYCGGW